MNIVPALIYAQYLFDAKVTKGTDKDVSAAVMSALSQLMPPATNKPNGGEIAAVEIKQPAAADKALSAVQSVYAKQAAGSISLTLLGEDHTNAQDAARAKTFIAAINAGSLTPSILVYERGLTYATPSTSVNIVRESNLTTISGGIDFGMGLSKAQRSMVVAGSGIVGWRRRPSRHQQNPALLRRQSQRHPEVFRLLRPAFSCQLFAMRTANYD